MSDSAKAIFISFSQDVAEFAAVAQDVIKTYSDRYGLGLDSGTFRDIDPNTLDATLTWQDLIGAPSDPKYGLVLILLGERIGVPLSPTFGRRNEIARKIEDQIGFEWVYVPGVDKGGPRDDQVPLTGILFELLDALLSPLTERTSLEIIFCGTTKPDNFGGGRWFNDFVSSSRSTSERVQRLEEYSQQVKWLRIVYNQLFAATRPVKWAETGSELASIVQSALDRTYSTTPLISSVSLPGLMPYDAEHRRFFFGRGEETRDLIKAALDTEERRRLVLLTGASGAGKSSILRAGLVAHARGWARQARGVRTAILSLADWNLSKDPVALLAEIISESAIAELEPTAPLTERIRADGKEGLDRLAEALSSLSLSQAKPIRLLLVIDQLEVALEAIDGKGDSASRAVVFLSLLAILSNGAGLAVEIAGLTTHIITKLEHNLSISVVGAIPLHRLDDIERWLKPSRNNLVTASSTITEAQVKAIVEGTFLELGAGIDADAAQALISDCLAVARGPNPGPILPLLGTTLKNIHEAQLALSHPNRPVSLNTVHEHGGIAKSIDRLGEEAFLDATAHIAETKGSIAGLPITSEVLATHLGEQSAIDLGFSRLFQRLIKHSGGDETIFLSSTNTEDLDPLARAHAEALLERRLLWRSGSSSVRLVHERIASNWTRLNSWRNDHIKKMRLEAELCEDARRFHRAVEERDFETANKLATFGEKRWGQIFELAAYRGPEVDPGAMYAILNAAWIRAKQDATFRGDALRLAMVVNQTPVFKELFAIGSDVEEVGPHKRTLLNFAAGFGRLDIAKYLLKRGASLEAVDDSGGHAIHVAAATGHDRLINLFLRRGESPNVVNSVGWTPLHFAIMSQRVTAVKILLNKGSDPERPRDDGWKPLHVAISEGSHDIVRLLLDHDANIEATLPNGVTPLFQAIFQGHDGLIDLLLEFGASTAVSNNLGLAPIHAAVIEGNEKTVSRLLKEQNALESRTSQGNTALHLAARAGRPEVTRLLLEAGANTEATDVHGEKPIHIAARGDLGVALAHVTELGSRRRLTRYARRHNRAAYGTVVQLLVQSGADKDAQDVSGRTPLYVAVMSDNEEARRVLIQSGADDDIPDANGKIKPWHLMLYSAIRPVVDEMDLGAPAREQLRIFERRPYLLECAADGLRISPSQLLLTFDKAEEKSGGTRPEFWSNLGKELGHVGVDGIRIYGFVKTFFDWMEIRERNEKRKGQRARAASKKRPRLRKDAT